jgi:hypothetical protein
MLGTNLGNYSKKRTAFLLQAPSYDIIYCDFDAAAIEAALGEDGYAPAPVVPIFAFQSFLSTKTGSGQTEGELAKKGTGAFLCRVAGWRRGKYSALSLRCGAEPTI